MKGMKGLYNVVFHDGNTEFPNDKILYIVTKKGTFLRKDLGTVRSCTKVDTISFLKEIEPYAELKIPQIGKVPLAISLSFLKWVYNTHNTEGGLLIYYNPETQKYLIHAPKQEVLCGGVSWNNREEPIPKGYIRMGTIHSHADMSAFHSGVDIQDEEKFDGLHITIGRLGEDVPTLVASVVVNGTRFPIKKEDIRRYLDVELSEGKDKTKNAIVKSEAPIYEEYQSWKNGRNGSIGFKHCRDKFRRKYKSYYSYKPYMGDNEMNFVISGLEPKDFRFPYEWKNQVEKKVYTTVTRYRVVNGKLVKSEKFKNECVDYGDDWMGHDYKYNQNINTHEPHPDSVSPKSNEKLNMWKELFTEAVGMGLVDLKNDFGIEDFDMIEKSEFNEDDDGNIDDDTSDYPFGLLEEDFQFHYGEHFESDDLVEDVKFDDDGNIVDNDGNIIEKLSSK